MLSQPSPFGCNFLLLLPLKGQMHEGHNMVLARLLLFLRRQRCIPQKVRETIQPWNNNTKTGQKLRQSHHTGGGVYPFCSNVCSGGLGDIKRKSPLLRTCVLRTYVAAAASKTFYVSREDDVTAFRPYRATEGGSLSLRAARASSSSSSA